MEDANLQVSGREKIETKFCAVIPSLYFSSFDRGVMGRLHRLDDCYDYDCRWIDYWIICMALR
jgi:hypothetical protein